jgi:RNA polymerase sigma-70 factor (ECF subfamily)
VTDPEQKGREHLSLTADRVTSPQSDAAVIERSCAEPERFGVIFDRYFDEVHRYLGRRAGVEAADDVAAEVFLTAFAQRQRYDLARDCARPWLYGIATNLMSAHWRQEARYYRTLSRAGTPPGGQNEEDRLAALAAALAGLAQGDRDVLLLVALAGFGYPEVAEALGIPPGTVASRLNRARRQLRAALGGINPAGHRDT